MESAEDFSLTAPTEHERLVDVILFVHGTLNSEDKELAEPWLWLDDADLFAVPANTEIYHYNEMEDRFDDFAQDEHAAK